LNPTAPPAAPLPPARRLSDAPEGTARDRLSSTLFVAALFHGIIILGVTFTAAPLDRDREPTSLDVVLVTRDYEQLAANDAAKMLATGTLFGRGNAALHEQLRTALTVADPFVAPGPDRDTDGRNSEAAGSPLPGHEVLTAVTGNRGEVLPERAGMEAPAARQQPLLAGDTQPADILAEPDSHTVIPDARPREIAVSANTRESRIASYLNVWKARMERIGTLNFPRAAWLQGLSTHPVIEVAISADGELREVVVLSSSGYAELDRAAVDIVHLAAPFEPFPAALREDYDVVRFAYEWHFSAGVARGRLRSLRGS
jgi:protein TonB